MITTRRHFNVHDAADTGLEGRRPCGVRTMNWIAATTKEQPFGVSLIQMPNGTGKTTTLSLLRAALSGVAENGGWTQKQVMDLRKRDDTETGCLFELRLAVNEKPLTIIMEFDFQSGRVNYKTTWGTGQTDGFKPPLELRRFMKDDFVNFYVFDGELAGNLLDDKHTDAGQAVETLFQVHLLSRMKEEVSKYWDRKTRSTTAKDKTGLTRRSNLLQQWKSRLDTLKKTKRKLERKLADIDRGLAAQRDQYERQISKETTREGTAQGSRRNRQEPGERSRGERFVRS